MKTLVIVDLQNDFMPGGRLGVPKGDELAAVINAGAPDVVTLRKWIKNF